MHQLTNHPKWREYIALIDEKLAEMALDYEFSKGNDMTQVGIEAVANYKAIHKVKEILTDLDWLSQEVDSTPKRDYE